MSWIPVLDETPPIQSCRYNRVGTNKASMSTPKKYQFVNQPPDDVICPICLDVLEEPHQVTCCGNHLCKGCGERLMLGRSPCPLCRKKQYHTLPDKYFERNTLNRLAVHCSEEECSWEGELSLLNNHILKNCKYVMQPCPNNCGRTFQRYCLEEHVQQRCLNRAYKCKYCGLESTFSQIQTNHVSVCPKEPIPCPNSCTEQSIVRELLSEHLEKNCPLHIIECTKCKICIPRKDLQQHMVEFSLQHSMNEICEKFERMSADTTNQLKEMKEHMMKKDQQLDKKDQQLALKDDELRLKDQLLVKKDALLAEKDKEIATKVASLKLLEDKVDQLLNMSLEEHRYFEVKGFDSLCELRKNWFSSPFFTHAGGYKMCFELDLNATNGKNLRIDMYLMNGPFDSYLNWPFTGRIAVRVLSHVSDSNHFDCFFDYNSRDKGHRVMGAGRGDYLESTSTSMKIKTMQEKHMLNNDTLKLKVIIIRYS